MKDRNETEVEKKQLSLNTLLVTTLFVLLAGLAAVLMFRGKQGKQGERPNPNEQSQAKNVDEGNPVVALDLDEMKEGALKAVTGFMEAKDVEKATEFIVGEGKRLELLQEFYRRPGQALPNGVKVLVDPAPVNLAGIYYLLVVAIDKDDNRYQFVVVPSDGEMRIDWKASFSYGELQMKELFTKQPKEPTLMRLTVLSELPAEGSGLMLEEIKPRPGIPESRFVRFSDGISSASFPALIAPGARKCHELATKIAENPVQVQVPVQVKVVWNDDFECVELKSLEAVWWFDYEWVTPDSQGPKTYDFAKE